MASRATESLANHDGAIGAVLQELGSSEGIKALATSIVTAGVVQGLGTSGLLPQNLALAIVTRPTTREEFLHWFSNPRPLQ